jgi:hypothetical protein
MVRVRAVERASARDPAPQGTSIMSASRSWNLFMFLVLAVSSLGLGSCGGAPVSCTPPLREYKGTCLDAVIVNFAGCTATRGTDLSTEEKQKFGATVDVGVRSVGGVVELSKKIVATENSDTVREIVRDCLELAKSAANPVDQTRIQQEVDQLQSMLDASSQGTISLSPDRGPYSQAIGVSGTHWPANVEVEVTANSAKVRTTTTADGSFQTTITLDPRFESVSASTVTIQVSPVKASTQMPATALYTIVK